MASQGLLDELSKTACTAYTAFSIVACNINNGLPGDAEKVIQRLQPTWTNIHPIYVWEFDPNVVPSLEATRVALHLKTSGNNRIIPGADCGKNPDEFSSGYQLFGYTATVPQSANSPAKNVLALRGTITAYEAGASLLGWDSEPEPCMLPTGHGHKKTQYGCIQPLYWSFYAEEGELCQTSLASSLKSAVRKTTDAASDLPWFAASHSLGGAMLCLGVFDAYESGCFPPNCVPVVATFGSVVVGDCNWACSYNSKFVNTYRVANLCDFVPALRGLIPGAAITSYTHVGDPYLFVWQTDSDWGNHSLGDIYMQVVNSQASYLNIYKATPGSPDYPVGIEKFGRLKD